MGIKNGKWEYWYQDGIKRLEDIYENYQKNGDGDNLIGSLIN